MSLLTIMRLVVPTQTGKWRMGPSAKALLSGAVPPLGRGGGFPVRADQRPQVKRPAIGDRQPGI